MSLFTRTVLRARAPDLPFAKTASMALSEQAKEFRSWVTYDIFLSHSYSDLEAIRGLKATLEGYGWKVYVDWESDPQLDRTKVTRATADGLRSRMRSSRSLVYAISPNASESRWMPWELGFFDGYKGKVALAPIVDNSSSRFEGQEYLSLYPYIDETSATLWINKPEGGFLSFKQWLDSP